MGKQKKSFYFFPNALSNERPFDFNYKVIEIDNFESGFRIRFSSGIDILIDGDVTCEYEDSIIIISGFSRIVYSISGGIEAEFYEGDFCLCGF